MMSSMGFLFVDKQTNKQKYFQEDLQLGFFVQIFTAVV